MLISTYPSACHGPVIRRKLAAINIEAFLVLGEGDNEVRGALLQRRNVDLLVKGRALVDSMHLLRPWMRTGLHQICQHHPRIWIPVRTGIYTKRAQSAMCSRLWTGNDSFEPSCRRQ